MQTRVATNPRKVRIAIINPMPGGNRATSLRNAERFVRRGVARWVGRRIEFIIREANERKMIAAELARLHPPHLAYDRVVRTMTLDEIAAIPVVCPERLMIDRSRGRSKPARN